MQCKDAISFPMNLDLTDYVHPVDQPSQATATEGKEPTEDQARLEYTLTGIILHRGTSASAGHYVAIVKDERTGDWWKYDDESVTNMGTHPFKGAKWDPVSGDDPSGSAAAGAKKGASASGKGGVAGGRGRGGSKKGSGAKKAGRGRSGSGRSKAAKVTGASEVADVIEIDAEQLQIGGDSSDARPSKRDLTNLTADDPIEVVPASKVAKQQPEPALDENRLAALLAGEEQAQADGDVAMKADEGMSHVACGCRYSHNCSIRLVSLHCLVHT